MTTPTPEQVAQHSLERGNTYPYDGDRPCLDWAHSAARGVLADFSDRRGIKWEIEKVDDEVRNDIVDAIAAIIRTARAQPPSAEVQRLEAEKAALRQHLLDMKNALWKATGDDRACVREYIVSQGGDPDAIDAALKDTP